MDGMLMSSGKRGNLFTLGLVFMVVFTLLFSSTAMAGVDFADSFEGNTYTPIWTDEAGAYTRAVTPIAAVGEYSFSLAGGAGNRLDGISTTLPNVTPTDIGFYIRTNNVTTGSDALGFLVIGGSSMTNGSISFSLHLGHITLHTNSVAHWAGAYAVDRWYHIEFRNIDWTSQTFDFYVDNALISASVPFWDAATSFTQMHLYNFTNATVWYDHIVLRQTDGAYIRGASAPWGATSNEAAMDRAFAEGWDDFRMADGAGPFLPGSGYETIYLEGSQLTAIELDTFLTANRTAIEGWVANGGRLFLNAAPNQGGNIDFGFGGVTLNYNDVPTHTVDVTASDPTHPVFMGPNIPITDTFSGMSFGHAYLTGGNLNPILIGAPGDPNAGESVLAEKGHGSGHVVMGGMVVVEAHAPLAEAANLRANILRYMGGDIMINTGFEIGDLSGWTEVETGAGNINIVSGETAFHSGLPIPSPPEGRHAAFFDPRGPGSGLLYQDFYVPGGYNSVTLRATIYIENLHTDYIDGTDFDDSGPGTNQKARLDLMDPTALVDDTGAGVFANLFITNPGDSNVIAPQVVSVDLTPYAGTTVRLRLGAVASNPTLLVGLDNIEIALDSGGGGGGGGGGCFISALSR